ncbi:MAG: hypothetical protein ABFS16_13760 [Bacteroidota bacterium]
MVVSNCENCKLRAKYDNKPKSILGRFWKWHIGWCPGWKSYLESLDEERRQEIRLQYNLK